MPEFLEYYAYAIAIILTVGETVIVMKGGKYWPLSLDDYLACGLLAWSAWTLESTTSQYLMLATFAFMAGNLYAMLFTRMDPVTGTRERLVPLAVLLIASLFGAGATLHALI